MESMENTDHFTRKIIIALLREDLRSNKLLLGLEQLGLIVDRYTLDVSDLVFELMGCTDKETNALLEVYREAMDEAVTIQDVDDAEKLNKMAEETYKKLLAAKQALKE